MKQEQYPALHQSASDLSKQSQDAFFYAFFSHMALLAVASSISVLNSPEPSFAIFQAMVLLGALGCAVYLYFVRPDRHWYSARAVAESVKTITWRYVCRAEPFNGADVADQHSFGLRLKSILEQNKDVAGLLVTHLADVQVSDEMDRLRKTSLDERQKYYREYRIVDQQSWYASKSAINKRKVKRYFACLILVILVAIFFAIAKIAFPKAPFWPTDVFVTVAAGLLSWIQAKKFQELSISYALTAHEISLIRQQSGNSMEEDEFSKFVGDAENAFSREHTQWVARQDQ